MTSIFESVSNQLSSLPHLIPSFVRKPNENDERIDDLENQIARLDRESKWCDVELDRRIKELTAEVDSLKRTQHHDRSLRSSVVHLVTESRRRIRKGPAHAGPLMTVHGYSMEFGFIPRSQPFICLCRTHAAEYRSNHRSR